MSKDGRRRPVKLVCETLRVERSSYYFAKGEGGTNVLPLKRGPMTAISDEELLELIEEDLEASPFSGEGHRKVWARLRRKGIRVGRKRVLRIMRVNGLLAPLHYFLIGFNRCLVPFPGVLRRLNLRRGA